MELHSLGHRDVRKGQTRESNSARGHGLLNITMSNNCGFCLSEYPTSFSRDKYAARLYSCLPNTMQCLRIKSFPEMQDKSILEKKTATSCTSTNERGECVQMALTCHESSNTQRNQHAQPSLLDDCDGLIATSITRAHNFVSMFAPSHNRLH